MEGKGGMEESWVGLGGTSGWAGWSGGGAWVGVGHVEHAAGHTCHPGMPPGRRMQGLTRKRCNSGGAGWGSGWGCPAAQAGGRWWWQGGGGGHAWWLPNPRMGMHATSNHCQ